MDNSVLKAVTESRVNAKLEQGINTDNTPEIQTKSLSIKDKSEETYLGIVQDVVKSSKENLSKIHKEKLELRNRLINFCLQILTVQMIFLILFLVLSRRIQLSDNVLTVYMTAVFVETLGAVVVMIKYAFKADEEVRIIDILNAIVKNFQKYGDSKDDNI